MKRLVGYFIMFLLICLGSCIKTIDSDILPNREFMEQLLKQNADSLAAILENINPNTLPDEDKAAYGFWLTKAHQSKWGRSLMNDTLIYYTIDYYKRNDSPDLTEAYILAAEQANWSEKDNSKSEQLLQEALHIAKSRKDTFSIQSIYSHLISLYRDKDDKYKIEYLIRDIQKYISNTPAYELKEKINLARLYSRLEMPDSALQYAKRGVELAQELHSQDEYLISRIYIDLLNKTEQSETALKILRELDSKRDILPVDGGIYFDYINTWISLDKLDSARIYIRNIEAISRKYNDNLIEDHITEILLGIYRIVVDAKENKSLFYPFSQYNISQPINKTVDRSRLEVGNAIEQQRMQDKLKEEKLMLDIEHEKFKQRVLWVVIGLLTMVVALVYLYQRKLLKKERYIQRVKEQLHINLKQLSENEQVIQENEDVIRSLSSQLDDSDDLKQEINRLVNENVLLKKKNEALQYDIDHSSSVTTQTDEESKAYENVLKQNTKLYERERFLTSQVITHTEILDKLNKRPHYIEKTEWVEIVHLINQLFDGFSFHLQTDFSNLTEDDIHYCCLFRLGFSTSVIGELMGISPSSVTKRKHRIKEKMNQLHPDKVLKEYPLEFYFRNI